MDKRWICTDAFNYAGQYYTVWVRPMYKHDNFMQHFESKVEPTTKEEAMKAVNEKGPIYFSKF